jgi:cation:H+ antiporter
MVKAVLFLVISLVGILAAAELFTNAIEWFGRKLSLAEGAVGSVLAAVGTALPETTIAVVAVIAGTHASTEAGIGAILGAPMMLATLAMFVTGIAVLSFARAGKRDTEMVVDYRVLGRDLRTFFVVYLIAMAASFIPFKGGKIAVGVFLLLIYVFYVKRTFSDDSNVSHGQELGPLHFHKKAAEPHLPMILVQLAASLALMIGGAKLFLSSVTTVAEITRMSPLVLSVIITPIATELPEKFNSVTWVRQKKDTLALGNISGAMVFQSSVTPAIGIFFTSWRLNDQAIASILIAVFATAILWAEMTWRKRLSPYSMLFGGLMYALYPIYVFGLRH